MFGLFSSVSHAKVIDAGVGAIYDPFPLVPLSKVIDQHQSGLDTDYNYAGWISSAEQYVKLRKGKLSAKKKLAWIIGCEKNLKEPIFCTFPIDRTSRGGTDDDDEVDVSSNRELVREVIDLTHIREYLTKSDLKKLEATSEAQFHRIFRQNDFILEPFQKLAERAIELKACPTSALLTAFGQKAEEFFPDPVARKLAEQLYSRSDVCGSKNDASAIKGRYRLALLNLWAERYEPAEKLLQKLTEVGPNDFLSRGLFWRSVALKYLGQADAAKRIAKQLYTQYPLTYHTLVLGKVEQVGFKKFVTSGEAWVRLRPIEKPIMGDVIAAVEALQKIRANDLALEILNNSEGSFDQLTPEERLYVAVLYMRAGDRIKQFKVMGSIFKEDSRAISRRTMEIFYPLYRFEVMKSYSAKVDPYLVAALIRQESGFNERARSPAGARGLMQLMPKTAKTIERRVSRRELYDAKTNIRLGVKFFKQVMDKYSGEVELALAAYNAGPDRVDDWLRRYPTKNRMLFVDLIPFKETREYVAYIGRNYFWYRLLYPSQSVASRIVKPSFDYSLFDVEAGESFAKLWIDAENGDLDGEELVADSSSATMTVGRGLASEKRQATRKTKKSKRKKVRHSEKTDGAQKN